jgi:hypothetical protein
MPFILNWENTATTQKHKFWQAETEMPVDELFFNLKANLNNIPQNLYANFQETKFATIASYLEGVIGGELQFKDPWFYFEFQDDWFHTKSFYSYESPYTFFNSTENSYGGVFLGQGYADPTTQ